MPHQQGSGTLADSIIARLEQDFEGDPEKQLAGQELIVLSLAALFIEQGKLAGIPKDLSIAGLLENGVTASDLDKAVVAIAEMGTQQKTELVLKALREGADRRYGPAV